MKASLLLAMVFVPALALAASSPRNYDTGNVKLTKEVRHKFGLKLRPPGEYSSAYRLTDNDVNRLRVTRDDFEGGKGVRLLINDGAKAYYTDGKGKRQWTTDHDWAIRYDGGYQETRFSSSPPQFNLKTGIQAVRSVITDKELKRDLTEELARLK
jgi:hypothetical protein